MSSNWICRAAKTNCWWTTWRNYPLPTRLPRRKSKRLKRKCQAFLWKPEFDAGGAEYEEEAARGHQAAEKPAAEPAVDEASAAPAHPVELRQELSAPVPPEFSGQLLTVRLRSTGDKNRDARRLKHVFGLLTSTPGEDRFALVCQENGHEFRMDFPNHSTSVHPALLKELEAVAGENCYRVE